MVDADWTLSPSSSCFPNGPSSFSGGVGYAVSNEHKQKEKSRLFALLCSQEHARYPIFSTLVMKGLTRAHPAHTPVRH